MPVGCLAASLRLVATGKGTAGETSNEGGGGRFEVGGSGGIPLLVTNTGGLLGCHIPPVVACLTCVVLCLL